MNRSRRFTTAGYNLGKSLLTGQIFDYFKVVSGSKFCVNMKQSVGWGKAQHRSILTRLLKEAGKQRVSKLVWRVTGAARLATFAGFFGGAVLCGCCGGRSCGEGVVIRSGVIKVVPLNIVGGPNASTAIKTLADCNLICSDIV